jgi:hypothetical protein
MRWEDVMAAPEVQDVRDFTLEGVERSVLFPLEVEQPNEEVPCKPFVAAFSCPACSIVTSITREQVLGFSSIVCGGWECSAEYRFWRMSEADEYEIVVCDPM